MYTYIIYMCKCIHMFIYTLFFLYYLVSVIDCGFPPPVDHAITTFTNETLFNSTVYYQCDPGYEITNGSFFRICQANRTWSGMPPVCTGMPCKRLTI